MEIGIRETRTRGGIDNNGTERVANGALAEVGIRGVMMEKIPPGMGIRKNPAL
jgi:hypothetical protein